MPVRRILILVLCAGVALSARETVARGGSPRVVLAVNDHVKIGQLERVTLRRIMSGRKSRWPDGSPIVLVFPPKGSAEMKWLCGTVVGVPEEVYRRFLLDKVFRGEMRPPIEVVDSQEASRRIAATRGAIGPMLEDRLSRGVRRLVLGPRYR